MWTGTSRLSGIRHRTLKLRIKSRSLLGLLESAMLE